MLFDLLKGYCLYKDGNLVPSSELPPAHGIPTSPPQTSAAVPPIPSVPPAGIQGQPGMQQTTSPTQTLDSNGQCCPQPNPISINITNSQDTNSRNLNTRQDAPVPVLAQPPQKVYVQAPPPQAVAPKIVQVVKREPPRVLYRDRVFVQPPVVQRFVQKVIEYVPTVQQVIKEVPAQIIYRTPPVAEEPIQTCKENFSPAFY